MAGVKQQDASGTNQSASAIRIRDNQRRSRARRKEYVENLERKVQEYERQGVEATRAMQHSARMVALENMRLRTMLQRMGMAASEVDKCLADWEDREAAEALSSVKKHEGIRVDDDGDAAAERMPPIWTTGGNRETSYFGSDSHHHHHQQQQRRGFGDGNSTNSVAHNAFDKLNVLASATLRQSTGSDIASPSTIEPSTGAVTPSSAYAPPLSPSASTVVQDFSSPMDMSCNAAAQIIAEMQGHGGQDGAKAALGCRRERDSMVKNPVLFSILEGGDGRSRS